MSFVFVGPEAVAAAAADLTTLGSTISAVNAAAAAPTTSLAAAGADEVSSAIAALFRAHGQAHQALSAQAAVFHQEFVRALTAGAGSYAAAEAAAASPLQTLVGPITAQVQAVAGGNGCPIYDAIRQFNEKLLITFTNAVGRLERLLVPYTPVTPPVTLPNPINGAVSLILSGTGANVFNQSRLDQVAQWYNLPGGFGAVWQPSQFFPLTPHLGNLTFGQSISQGAQYLDEAIRAEVGNNATDITVWTVSQSAVVATLEIRHLMSIGSPFQNQLHFVLVGDPNNPDGGIFERLLGLYVPGIDVYANGATPPNSPYPATIYTHQYDPLADFPQYILNPVSDINAIMGPFSGTHYYPSNDLAAAIKLPTSPGYNGLTTYYWIPQQNLPLLAPLRSSVPAPFGNAMADLLQPDLRVLVDMGYASGNYANIPTPGQFFELPDPFTIVPDLAEGAVQGATAFGVDLGWLPQSMMPTTYPYVPTLDPHLNFPIGQHSMTGFSLMTGAEGQLMRSLALIPSWWDSA